MVKHSELRFDEETLLELAPPASGRAYYYDTELPGLGVRVMSSGTRTFFAEHLTGNRGKRVVLGTVGRGEQAWSLSRVREDARRVLGELAPGTAPDDTKLNFTKDSLDLLMEPPSGWRYFYDTRVPGLALGVSSSGARTFILYRKIHGRPERIKIGAYMDKFGRHSGFTIDQARNRAHQLGGEIAGGLNPADDKRRLRDEMTFRELWEIYYRDHSEPNKKTAREDRFKFERYLCKNGTDSINLASKKISRIERSDIVALFNRISREHKATANRVLALVSSVFGKAIEWGLWERENPCRRIKKHPERARDRFLYGDELRRIFRALEVTPNDVARDYVLLSLFTGARRGNVTAMRWEEVNWERAEWRIPTTKNGTPQSVPLIPEAIDVLRRRRAEVKDAPFVFPSTATCGHYTDPKRGFQRVLSRAHALALVDELAKVAGWNELQAKHEEREAIHEPEDAIARLSPLAAQHGIDSGQFAIKDLRIHDLRRTFGSWQASTGASLAIIGRSLNHKSIQSTQIYARLSLDPVRQSMQKAAQAMLLAAGVTSASPRAESGDRPGEV